jgi:hypothetical protein
MRPAIVAGERVRVVAGDGPRRGEVWAFVRSDGDIVVHRMMRRLGDLYVFRGDTTPRDDEPVAPDLLIGRVDEVEGPEGRRNLTSSARFFGLLRSRLGAARHALRRGARRVAGKLRKVTGRAR